MEKTRIRTHVVGFDDALGGGIPDGYQVLVSGAPGTMKSSFCFSVAYHNALKNGMNSAYITLEQGKNLLLEHMHSLGMNDPKAYEHLSILDMGTIRKNLSFLQAKGSWLDLFKMYANNFV
ncbi:MAG TPA: RAD55 family ATPase, partial [Thermoplasmata archaeon]|nr:RAD55 family ATPase [Thermoplasmata archaeon]